MGWKISAIVIKDPGNVSDDAILNRLFTVGTEKLPSVSFDECIYPKDEESLYFGNYKNCLIITCTGFNLVEKFFTNNVSKAETIFMDLFPNSEIGAFTLHSVVNYYAWAVITKGQKVRSKMGDGDNGNTLDFGTPLPEEEEFLKLSFLDKKGKRKYNFPIGKAAKIEVLTEDQIGENYVEKI